MNTQDATHPATIHTDLATAYPAFHRFLHPDSPERWFVYEHPSPFPVDNCLCWWEYGTPAGALRASLRWTVLNAAFGQPFSAIKRTALRLFGARIHPRAYLSPQVFIDPLFPSLLRIEEGALLGLGVRIALHEHAGNRFRAGRVTIGRGATIGADSNIACGITIGAEARIGLGSVVLRDIPAGAIAIGNPARVIGRINDPAPARQSA